MFGQSVDAQWYFESEAHAEAQNRLMYVAEQGEPFVLLLGERGLGKSRVLCRVQDECRRFGHSSVLLNVAALDETAFLWHLCGSLSIIASDDHSRSQMMASIRDEISGRALCNHRTVVLLDDANRAGEDLGLMIQFLSALNQQTDGGITVIAAAEEHLLSPGLASLSALRVRLAPLSDSDSHEFVNGILAADSLDSVTVDGVAAIVSLCGGSPAQLTRVCDLVGVAHTTHPELQINAEVLGLLTEETLVG